MSQLNVKLISVFDPFQSFDLNVLNVNFPAHSARDIELVLSAKTWLS